MSQVLMELKSLLKDKLTKEASSELQGLKGRSVGLELDGSSTAALSLSVTAEGPIELKDGLNGKMDCVIRCSSETFSELKTGKLNIAWALMTRKIKVEGSLDLAKDFGLALKKIWHT